MKWLVFGLALVPQVGVALSCRPSNLAGDFLYANERAELFSILIGTINRPTPEYGGEDSFAFGGEFSGQAMRPDGTLMPYRSDVQIEGQCINGDCGWIGGATEEQIVFAYPRDGALVINVFPCSAVPTVASVENIAQLRSCLTGGDCEAPDWDR